MHTVWPTLARTLSQLLFVIVYSLMHNLGQKKPSSFCCENTEKEHTRIQNNKYFEQSLWVKWMQICLAVSILCTRDETHRGGQDSFSQIPVWFLTAEESPTWFPTYFLMLARSWPIKQQWCKYSCFTVFVLHQNNTQAPSPTNSLDQHTAF